MAYTYTWPTALPQSPQKGYSETGGVLAMRTPMDAGPAKLRRRGQKPQMLNVTFLMTSAQVVVFEDFVKNTIKGVARFGFAHPRTGSIAEVRIIPEGEGNLYNMSYTAPGYYTLQFQLEVLP